MTGKNKNFAGIVEHTLKGRRTTRKNTEIFNTFIILQAQNLALSHFQAVPVGETAFFFAKKFLIEARVHRINATGSRHGKINGG